MPRRLRIILTAVFVAGFAVAAPLTLLYTAGYSYDWAKHRLEKTGIIQTDSVPAGATVLLDGAPTGAATPSPISRLLPEDYRVRYEKDGYFPWEKSVEVKSGETTFVTSVALIKDGAPTLVRETPVAGQAFSADGRRVAWFSDGATWSELDALDLSSGARRTAAPVMLARFAKGALAAPRLRWSPDGRRLLLTAANAKRGTTLIVYDVAGSAAPIALGESFPAGALSAAWSDDGASLSVTTPAGAYFADASTGAVTPAVVSPGIADTAIVGRTMYLLRRSLDGTSLERRGVASTAVATTLALLPLGADRFLDTNGPFLLVADDERGKLLVVSPDDGAVADTLSATDASWSGKGRNARLLAWNGFEITVADPRAGTRQLVTRIGEPIGSCAWHPSGFAVFYSAGGKLHAVDLDDREPKNVNDLAADTAGAFAVDAADGMLRFAASPGGKSGLYERAY